MSETKEILVHVSASTTRRNDDLYRALADAYTEFEPYGPENVKNPRNNVATESLSSSKLTAQGSSFQAVEGIPSIVSSNDSYGSFPSYSVSSDRAMGQGDSSARNSSGAADEDSVLPQSRLDQLERIQARWREGQAAYSSSLDEKRHSVGLAISSLGHGGTFIEDTQLAAHAIESQLLDHFSTTSEEDADAEPTGEVSLPPNGDDDRSGADFSERESDAAPQKSVSIRETERKSGTNSPTSRPLAQATAIISDRSSVEDITSSEFLDFSNLPLVAYPPAPKITLQCPGTLPSQVTRHLEAIKRQNPDRFKPTKRLRRLDPDERGHWLVNCRNWTRGIQHEFYVSLCDDIHSGRLGWGVTLHRESDSPRTLGQVRLYCWGELVEHIWLSMWLCSNGKISGSSSRWLDAEERVVVEVP